MSNVLHAMAPWRTGVGTVSRAPYAAACGCWVVYSWSVGGLPAAHEPTSVGQVTYRGNITAHAPMWQWTVQDYPHCELNTSSEAGGPVLGTGEYPLLGEPFVAVSGYLPSFLSLTGEKGTTLGIRDKTQLRDHGLPILTGKAAEKGAVSFTLRADSQDVSGRPVTGVLTLEATELRAFRYVYLSGPYVEKWLVVNGSTEPIWAVENGSCFIGTGRYSQLSAVVSGTPDAPLPGEQSPDAFGALLSALQLADSAGNAPPYVSFEGDYVTVGNTSAPCSQPTSQNGIVSPGMENLYSAGAHVLVLTPRHLAFPTPVQGRWSATLSVEAYQM